MGGWQFIERSQAPNAKEQVCLLVCFHLWLNLHYRRHIIKGATRLTFQKLILDFYFDSTKPWTLGLNSRVTCKICFRFHACNHIFEAIISFKSACLANSKWWMTSTNRHVKFNLQLSENLIWNFSKDTISLQNRQNVFVWGFDVAQCRKKFTVGWAARANIFTWQLKCNYQPCSHWCHWKWRRSLLSNSYKHTGSVELL